MPNEKPNIYAYPINVLNHKKFKLLEDDTLKDLPETQYKCRLLEKSVEILRQAGVVEVPPVDKRSGLVTTKHGQFQVKVDDTGKYHIFPTPPYEYMEHDIVDAFNAERDIGCACMNKDIVHTTVNSPSSTNNEDNHIECVGPTTLDNPALYC